MIKKKRKVLHPEKERSRCFRCGREMEEIEIYCRECKKWFDLYRRKFIQSKKKT